MDKVFTGKVNDEFDGVLFMDEEHLINENHDYDLLSVPRIINNLDNYNMLNNSNFVSDGNECFNHDFLEKSHYIIASIDNNKKPDIIYGTGESREEALFDASFYAPDFEQRKIVNFIDIKESNSANILVVLHCDAYFADYVIENGGNSDFYHSGTCLYIDSKHFEHYLAYLAINNKRNNNVRSILN